MSARLTRGKAPAADSRRLHQSTKETSVRPASPRTSKSAAAGRRSASRRLQQDEAVMGQVLAAPRQLGHDTPWPDSPEAAQLERVPNPHPAKRYLARFTAPEFTSLCPVTGQPDFAHLVIDYVPRDWLLESKSLKLYLGSFRNHGAFHEDCTIAIAARLVGFLRPHWLRIGGYWYPRGGIPIDVFWQSGRPPAGLWIPEQGVPGYRGRG